MARSPIVDPRTSEARSSWLAGMTEVCNRITGVLDMKTADFRDVSMPELYISESDRYRIYQVDNGHRCWMQSPQPVIKKNGSIITELSNGFSIDYLGGSIAFEDDYRLTADDVLTVSATHMIDGSNQISNILSKLNELSDATSVSKNYKGYYTTLADLQNSVQEAEQGDYAIVQETSSIYIWNSEFGEWVDTYKAPDLSAYYTSEQVDSKLELKEDNIAEHGLTNEDDVWYYGGRKLWVNLYNKVLETAISGVVSTENESITETDTILSALGKLQAQITNNVHPIKGTGEPTSATTGIVGQDYINTSTGDKWHLTTINEDGTYVWEQYVDVSKLDDKVAGYLPLTGGTITGTLVVDNENNISPAALTINMSDNGNDVTSRAGILIKNSEYDDIDGEVESIVALTPHTHKGVTYLEIADSNGLIGQPICIRGVRSPDYIYDVANKKYVDDLVGDIGTILDSINGEEAAVLAEQIVSDSWEDNY